MNAQQKAREQAEVMLAWANGEEIERLPRGANEWLACLHPQWEWYSVDYRIKPKVKKIKLEAWLCKGELRYFQNVDEELEPNCIRLPALDIETELSE